MLFSKDIRIAMTRELEEGVRVSIYRILENDPETSTDHIEELVLTAQRRAFHKKERA